MKKITILAASALLMIPLFSETMEQIRKLKNKSQLMVPLFSQTTGQVRKLRNKLHKGELRRNKNRVKEENEVQIQQEGNSVVCIEASWNGCPTEIKMYVLSFVLNFNIVMNAIAIEDRDTILGCMRQWIKLLSVDKEMNLLSTDKQIFNLEEINGSMLEHFPGCLLELVRRVVKLKGHYLFRLPTFIVLPKEKSAIFDLLGTASSHGHTEFCQKLIDAGIFKDAGNENQELIHAIYLRDKHVVKKLIDAERGHASLHNGKNQLMMALGIGDIAITKLLLNQRPNDLNAKDENGRTVLMYAVQKGSRGFVELFLKKGAGIDQKDNDGTTALILAALNGNEKVVELLLKKGAIVDQADDDGRTAVMIAVQKELVVELLLKKGAVIEQVDYEGKTALMVAAKKGWVEVVQLLLKKGAAIDKRDDDGRTALMLAVRKGYIQVVELLLKKGANIILRSHNDETALSLALEGGYPDIAQLLQSCLLQSCIDSLNSQEIYKNYIL